ncbi:uncharacterized protein F4807DRAFT_188497 [Annulohypoxylon truncatum]|uniref:uncharacterized protein n=1 Tax=Annulohypoxylon truncatum TaxID=327061 RepID=UPI002007309C|nr:uncharacterized protein F4807DRAFT_188497 [Annulohypoxylon truncatum]KAI1207136.1 hypothetical protein F4807DRAFT_188497 [Annulohypoxylon truncatum]
MTVPGRPRKGNQDCSSPTKRKRAETGPILSNKRARPENSFNLSSTDDAKILQAVESKYDVQVHSIISSSKIQKKVAAILQHLDSPASKTAVSILRAKASDAGKLVSVAEIAKRELGKRTDGGRVWFQYIALGEELKEIPREGDTVIEETRLDDDDVDFEVMKTPFQRAIETQPRLRGVPIVSLFLCRVSIEELKRYGEQTSTGST